MAEEKKQRFCVVDHANKAGDRDKANPNLVSKRRARYRRMTASVNASGGTDSRDPDDGHFGET